MSQLLVRKLDPLLVQKLKTRARAKGISVEEEHRRILANALLREEPHKPSLINFLYESEVMPGIDLELARPSDLNERDLGF